MSVNPVVELFFWMIFRSRPGWARIERFRGVWDADPEPAVLCAGQNPCPKSQYLRDSDHYRIVASKHRRGLGMHC